MDDNEYDMEHGTYRQTQSQDTNNGEAHKFFRFHPNYKVCGCGQRLSTTSTEWNGLLIKNLLGFSLYKNWNKSYFINGDDVDDDEFLSYYFWNGEWFINYACPICTLCHARSYF